MVSKYSVVQYLPDVGKGEIINIGVVVWNDTGLKTAVATDWDRVTAFAQKDSAPIKDHISGVLENLDEEGLLWHIAHNMNSIQYTQPRPTIQNLDEALASISKIFL